MHEQRLTIIRPTKQSHGIRALLLMSSANMKDLLHVAVRCGLSLLRITALLTLDEISCIPIPPVVLTVCLFELIVMLRRLVQEFCKCGDVHGLCSRRLPLTAGKPRCDLLQQPAVPVRILKRG